MKGLGVRITVLVALGVVDVTLHRPWRLLALAVILVYVVQWTAFRHRREVIHMIRQRRHRLANHLQLVAGWLQLGATAKAEEALQTLLEAELSQSVWFRGLPSRWSFLFLRWDARGEEHGIGIRWAGLDTLVPTYRMAWMLEYRLVQAIRVAETAMTVEFRGERFRLRVPDCAGRLPRGWIVTDDGYEVLWAPGRSRTLRNDGPAAGI